MPTASYNEVVMFGIKRAKMESYWNRENSDVFLVRTADLRHPQRTAVRAIGSSRSR